MVKNNAVPVSTVTPFSASERSSRSAVLIVNTKARRGQDWYVQAQEHLRAQGVTVEAAYPLADPSLLPEVTGEALDRGARLIVIGGGDGSFRCVAGMMAAKDAILGILPLGTVNDLARNLGIEADLEAACRVIAEGQSARIDVGQANDHYFLITASLGFSAQVQQELTPGLKKWFGPLGYFVASLRALHHVRHLRITIRGEEDTESLRAIQAGVVHGHFWMGGAFEIPGVNLENGRLAFYALPPQGKLAFLHLLYNLMHDRFFSTPGLRAFTTCDLTVETDRPQPLVLDGDLCGETPVRLCLHREALQVCVPAT
ncbi:MAG TPA: YegS/Rv2252/BmrU family lipid kinase [Chthonomonadaceae bacterium]|nr:YegS/Rv2252/BmrU family lipid kinase [Chthonomonadaceae bacterium]